MKKVVVAVAVIASLAVWGIAIQAGAASPQYSKGHILVKFRSSAAMQTVAASVKGRVAGDVGDTGVKVVSVAAGAEEAAVRALSRNPHVEFAETDPLVNLASADPLFDRQWALENTGQAFATGSGAIIAAGIADADIDAPEAWVVTRGNAVRVAVLDTGVASDNADITQKVVGAKNFSDAASIEDNYGHGTHVAGVIAAATDNDAGVAGVCPDCSILSGKVLNDSGAGAASWVANGISWAVANNAQVINMSLSFGAQSKTLQTAIDNAWNKGVVLVAAAGNDGNSLKEYPAGYSNVIAVAATNNSDKKAGFSNYGAKWVDIAAPGENVYSTFPGHAFTLQQNGRALNYDVASGTSMASPVVAGVVALTWAVHPEATNAAVRQQVQLSATPIAGTGSYWANGRVNALKAVSW